MIHINAGTFCVDMSLYGDNVTEHYSAVYRQTFGFLLLSWTLRRISDICFCFVETFKCHPGTAGVADDVKGLETK